MKKEKKMIGTLVRNKLTKANGIVVGCTDNYTTRSKEKLKINYLAEEVPLCNLIGRQIFSYAGKIVFQEYCFEEEIEIIE